MIVKGLAIFYIVSWLCHRFHNRKPIKLATPQKKMKQQRTKGRVKQRAREAGLTVIDGGKK